MTVGYHFHVSFLGVDFIRRGNKVRKERDGQWNEVVDEIIMRRT
jgi:hypothetical protein